LLIENKASVQAEDLDGNTPLHLLRQNDQQIAELLIRNGANLEAKNRQKRTALHKAVENNLLEVTELLLNKGAEVNARDYQENTPLFWAQNAKMIELLTAKNADVNAKNHGNNTPLHWAATTTLERISTLCTKGANVDVQNNFGNTAAHNLSFQAGFMSQCDREAHHNMLISYGADMTIVNEAGFNPITLAEHSAKNRYAKLCGADKELEDYATYAKGEQQGI
jgi:ankyrin repeat protein